MDRPLTSSSPAVRLLPLRPAAHAESLLVDRILDGSYPPESDLPAERALAEDLGVTRPTVREALKRLERDGWISIQHGKPTRVRDIYKDGGLNILGALVKHGATLPEGFIQQLLEVRLVMTPAYTRAALERDPEAVASLLAPATDLPDNAHAFASFDWNLHGGLTLASGNVVFRLILNGFRGFYEETAQSYFESSGARKASREFYAALLSAAMARDAKRGESITRETMKRSVMLWLSRTAREEEKEP